MIWRIILLWLLVANVASNSLAITLAFHRLPRRAQGENGNYLNATTIWTNEFVVDRGVTGGPGALTTAGPTNANFGLWWSGVLDAFSRVNTETNNSIGFLAYGSVNGQSTLTAWLDSQPIQIMDVGTNNMQWRTFIELSPGTHQLKVNALHPSGFYIASATNTFNNSVTNQVTLDTFDGGGNITNRVYYNTNGVVNRTQSLSYDAKGRLLKVTELNPKNYGYIWSAVYDALGRRLSTTTMLVSNTFPSAVPPQVLNSYFDPQAEFLELGVTLSSAPDVEFLEAGTSPSTQTTWKLYGPDLDGKYGGLNGIGGLEGVSPYQNVFNPVISDARGNVLAQVTNGVVSWTLARPTAYGTVPGYRAVAFGNGVDFAQSCVYHGREVDVPGTYHFGVRDYDPISQQWLQHDPSFDERNPNGQSYCGGDPGNYTDANGLMGKAIGPDPLAQFQEQTADYLQSQYGELPGSQQPSEGQVLSSMADMIPVIGGIKMWYELGTGFDTVTGQRIESSDWAQVAMIGLNIVPVAVAAAPEAAAIESQVNIPFYGIGEDIAVNAVNEGASAPVTGSQWFQYFSDKYGAENVTWESGASSGIWDLGIKPRGLAIESLLGGNLPPAYPVIDQFNQDTGVATSIKSIDLNAPTYQNASALASTINGYVDSVAEFNGANWANVNIRGSQITVRQLQLGVPVGSITPTQQSAIDAATIRAQGMGVNLVVTPVP